MLRICPPPTTPTVACCLYVGVWVSRGHWSCSDTALPPPPLLAPGWNVAQSGEPEVSPTGEEPGVSPSPWSCPERSLIFPHPAVKQTSGLCEQGPSGQGFWGFSSHSCWARRHLSPFFKGNEDRRLRGMKSYPSFYYHSLPLIFFCWSMIALLCCASICYTTK